MKYPIDIEIRLEEIEEVISTWPKKKRLEDVITWMLQFDNEDFDLAFRIIKNLNVIGPEELNSALAISYSKLMRRAKAKKINISLKNTMFAAIGGASKSGAMIAYNFRLINELAAANFLDEETIKFIEAGEVDNLVLVDDIIATGDQSAKELKEVAELVIPLGVKNIFVLTAVGMKEGIKKVQDTELAEVFSALEYDKKDTLNSLDSNFYEGLTYQERKDAFDKIRKYNGFGYKEIGALITFFYNTPNCTIQSIWGDRYGWIPLFERVSGVTGIDKHYPKLEKATPTNKPRPNNPDSFTIFVEGKQDEMFFDLLASQYDNFGFKEFDAISIGAFFSDKLLGSLSNIAPNYIVVIDEDDHRVNRAERIQEIVGENNVLVMDDFIKYVDIESVIKSEEFSKYFERELFSNEFDIDIDERHIQMRLLRKAPPSSRERNLQILVERYMNKEKLNELVSSIMAIAKPKTKT